MVQKAVEMGVARLAPVMTRHTQAERVNIERMRANAIEAAEQCGVLQLPEIAAPVALADALAGIAAERVLVFCTRMRRSPIRCGAAPRPHRRWPCWSGRGGCPEERHAAGAPHIVRLALGLASCAPIPPQSRRLRWCRLYWRLA
jgi:16S rRNA (uracil1498-N3)-methyltransferase